MDIPSVVKQIQGFYTPVADTYNIRKIFPYVEEYNANKKTIFNQYAPNNMPKVLYNLHRKFILHKEPYVHSNTLKYRNGKFTNNSFIETVKMELLISNTTKFKTKPKNLRSLSEPNKKIIKKHEPEPFIGELIVLPASNFQKNVRNKYERKESITECHIDFDKLDLPYVKKLPKTKNNKIHKVETKDESITAWL
jgi:hypothetical protein